MNGKQLKNSILQWAIQGKLVPQDPNDEPASVLLEKIRAEKARLVKEGKIKKDKNESIIYRGDNNSHYEKFADGTIKCIDEEIPFDLPKGWEWTRIRNVSQSYIGLTYKPSEIDKNGVIVLRSSNIKNGKLCFDDIVRVSKSIPTKLQVEVNDIVICARNGSKKLVGKSALVTEVSENMTFGAFMAICKSSLYSFIFQYLQSDLFFSQLRGVSGTTTINQLTQNNFNGFLIPIPPLNEQLRIVAKLNILIPIVEAYEKSQDSLDKLNFELPERIKKSILQEAIQGRLVPQNPEDEPASKLLERIREEKQKMVAEGRLKKLELNDSVIFRGDDNKYYEKIGNETKDISEEIPYDIPENWRWCRFSSVVNFRIGKTPERGNSKYWITGKIPWVSISDMKDCGIIDSTKEYITDIAAQENFKNRISPQGSLIMSFKLTIGRTSILGIDAYHNEAIITINPIIDSNNGFRNYLKYVLPILSNVGDSKDAIKGKTLNSKSIAQLLLPIPPIEEQIRIVEKYELLLQKL